MNFQPVDYAFGIIVLLFALAAMKKGFVSEVLGKAAWVLGVIAGCMFYRNVAINLHSKIVNYAICNILGFLVVFIVVFLVVKICEYILGMIFKISILRSLDKALGLLFGVAEGFAVVCLIIFILNVQPFVEIGNLFRGSFFAGLMNSVLNY